MPKSFVKIVITNIFKEKFKKYCNAVFTLLLDTLILMLDHFDTHARSFRYSYSIISILILDQKSQLITCNRSYA
ncbi:unnamed protein product [Rhizophagus irregularis]|nr:unnamed protein product [Rhizophagus irregularis]CAB5374213.1 unnamed protein product [Rhizophagus irregularis]